MHTYHNPFMSMSGPWVLTIVLIAVLLFAFEAWMIIDTALNKKISDKAKVWWILGMLLIHPIVAIVYFLTDRRKR